MVAKLRLQNLYNDNKSLIVLIFIFFGFMFLSNYSFHSSLNDFQSCICHRRVVFVSTHLTCALPIGSYIYEYLCIPALVLALSRISPESFFLFGKIPDLPIPKAFVTGLRE